MNDFFPRSELLAGLSEDQQNELRTHIGLNTIIDDLSNNSIITDVVKINSKLHLNLYEAKSNNYLKCIDEHGRAVWAPLPTYEEMVGITMENISENMKDILGRLDKLHVEKELTILSNVRSNSILMNEDSNGRAMWSQLENVFTIDAHSNDSVVPSMAALSNLYDLTLNDNNALYSNVLSVANNKDGLLLIENNLEDLLDKSLAMSNLGLTEHLHTKRLSTTSAYISNAEMSNGTVDYLVSSNIDVQSNILFKTLHGHMGSFSSNIVSSNATFENTTSENITSTHIYTSNVQAVSASLESATIDELATSKIRLTHDDYNDNDILIVKNDELAFKKLTSSYNLNSITDVPNSKALYDAVQFIDGRIQNITNDPSFTETYIRIGNNLREYRSATLSNIYDLHENLRLSPMARDPNWQYLTNIPSELLNLEAKYLERDLKNLDLNDFNTKLLRDSMSFCNMAYQDTANVNIRGGEAKLRRLQAEHLVLNVNENTVEERRDNQLDEVYLYLRHAGLEGGNPAGTGKWTNLPIKQEYYESGKNSMPSATAMSNLYTYITNPDRIKEHVTVEYDDITDTYQNFYSNEYLKGFLEPHYSNVIEVEYGPGNMYQYTNYSDLVDKKAASAGALWRFHDFLRSCSNGFLQDDFKSHTSKSNAPTAKSLTDLYSFVRSDTGFLVNDYKGTYSKSNAPTSESISKLHDFLRSASADGYLIQDFSNQNSTSNAPTAKALTDLYNYLTDGFLAKDFTESGNDQTAATSLAMNSLYRYVTSSNYISSDVNDSNDLKVSSASVLSNMYFNDLSSESFFESHNRYLFEKYLIQQADADVSTSNPFSSFASSNFVHGMITERGKLFNALLQDNSLESNYDVDSHDKIATARAVYNLSTDTNRRLDYLGDGIFDTLKLAETNLNIFNRISLYDENSNPLSLTQADHCNLEIELKYDGKYFALNQAGRFSIVEDEFSSIAKNSIKLVPSPDDSGYCNLIEIEELNPGEFQFSFQGTSLLDEISRDVAKATAEALLEYGADDYKFFHDLYVNSNLHVESNIYSSNIYLSNDIHVAGTTFTSNIEVEGISTLKDDVRMFSDLHIDGKLTSDIIVDSNVEIAGILSVGGGILSSNEIVSKSNIIADKDIFVKRNLNVSNDVAVDNLLSTHALIVSENATFPSNLILKSKYHEAVWYSCNANQDFGENNIYLDGNNVDKLVFSNIPTINMLESRTLSDVLSVNHLYASNLSVHGMSSFQNTIQGTIERADTVLTEKYIEFSDAEQRFYPVSIDSTDVDDHKELKTFSNMYFDKNLEINIETNVNTNSLSVSRLAFDVLERHVQIKGENVIDIVPNSSNVYVKRVYDDFDGSTYNLALIKSDPSQERLSHSNQMIQFSSEIVYRPDEMLLSVGKIASSDGFQVENLNAANLSVGGTYLDLNPKLKISQSNLNQWDLSVRFSYESTIANTLSLRNIANTEGLNENLIFAEKNSETFSTRPDVKYVVDGDQYGFHVNTTKVLNNLVQSYQLKGKKINIGDDSNIDDVFINEDGYIQSKQIATDSFLLKNNDLLSGQSGEMRFVDGKFLGHDGTKFKRIAGSTANDDQTGMFLNEGDYYIRFLAKVNGDSYHTEIRSNVVIIPRSLSVRDVNVSTDISTSSITLKDSVRMKRYPHYAQFNDDTASYISSGSSILNQFTSYHNAFNYSPPGDTYGAWISAPNYNNETGDPDENNANTFTSDNGISIKGEYIILTLSEESICLKEFHIQTRGAADYHSSAPPKDITVLGSQDGSNWYILAEFNDLIFSGKDGLRLQIPEEKASDSYLYDRFALVVRKIHVHGNRPSYCAIGEWELYTKDDTATSLDLDHINGKAGQFIFSKGQFLGHDGTKFKTITGTNVNDGRTGVFMEEDSSNILFIANSNESTGFEMKIQESNIFIPAMLSVKDAHIDMLNTNNQTSSSIILFSNNSNVAQQGELRFFDGFFQGHDGLKFRKFGDSSTVNDRQTGMFINDGNSNITFMTKSNDDTFSLKIDEENNVTVPSILSVKNFFASNILSPEMLQSTTINLSTNMHNTFALIDESWIDVRFSSNISAKERILNFDFDDKIEKNMGSNNLFVISNADIRVREINLLEQLSNLQHTCDGILERLTNAGL